MTTTAASRPATLAGKQLARIDWLTRLHHWLGKVADLSLFTGFALATSAHLTGRLFATACFFLLACGGQAVFGYAWNDVCDAEIDARVGKGRPSPTLSKRVARVALGFAAVGYVVAARLSPTLLALAFAAIAVSWAYSGSPIRLKERGALGLLGGAVAQRTVPAIFVLAALDVSLRHAVPWLVWMTCWGSRGMVVHQVIDAANDRLSGLTTWGAHPNVRPRPGLLLAVLVPIETASFVLALVPLLGATSVLIAGAVALAVWLLLTAGMLRRFGWPDWFSFRHMPLESLYAVFGPLVVAAALLRLGGWVAPVWVVLDAMLRMSPVRRTLRELLQVWNARGGRSGAGVEPA